MGTDLMTWVASDGSETSWPVKMLKGVSGRGAPPVDMQTFPNPARAGSSVSNLRHAARRISIPVVFANRDCSSETEAAVRLQLRSWAQKLSTLDGPGRLRFSTVAGDVREIDAYYVGGLELQEDSTRYLRATIEFACLDVYFEDASETVVSAAGASVSTALFFPILPLVLASSEVSAELSIVNDGDVETWPVLSVRGPAISPILKNITTGEVLSLGATIGVGETVTFDSRPGRKTVLRQDGLNLYSSLVSKQWWALARTTNRIRLEATGTTADTLMSVSYVRRWLTA